MTDQEQQLLQRLAHEGKPTRLTEEELQVAKRLEADELVFVIPQTLNAVITPKGRHALAGPSQPHGKRRFGFIE